MPAVGLGENGEGFEVETVPAESKGLELVSQLAQGESKPVRQKLNEGEWERRVPAAASESKSGLELGLVVLVVREESLDLGQARAVAVALADPEVSAWKESQRHPWIRRFVRN